MPNTLILTFTGTPRGLDFSAVENSFYSIPGVKDLHDLRMWSLSLNKVALAVHIAVGKQWSVFYILRCMT